jgi:7-cyano-7-deazaguanine synthase
MTNSVVIVSGGLDSVVLLHYVCKRLNHKNVNVLTFNYGQRIVREIECAKYQVNALRQQDPNFIGEHKILDLSVFKDLAPTSALTNTNIKVPSVTDDLGNAQPVTYVPFRNALFLTFAAAFAESKGGNNVFYGAQNADEHSGYWDTNTTFLNNVNRVFNLNRKNPITVQAPFITFDKEQIVRLGNELGVNFTETHTCYNGKKIGCGACVSCSNRIQAFLNADLRDPIEYEIEIPWKPELTFTNLTT